MNIDTAKLQYFLVAADTQNLQEASRLLNLTPAALSKSIRLLESELEVSLFLREGRKIILTDQGLRIAQRCKLILEQIESQLYQRKTSETEQEHLRIGSFEVFTTYFIGALVKQEFGKARLTILELTPGHLETALEDRSIDYGITYLPIPNASLDFLKIGTLTTNLYAVQGSAFDFKKWDEVPFAVPVTPVTGSPNRVKGLDGWPDDKIPRYRKYQVTMMETALELVRQGLAIAFLPDFIVSLHNKNCALKLVKIKKRLEKIDFKQDVYLVKRKSTAEDKNSKKIARCLRQVCLSL